MLVHGEVGEGLAGRHQLDVEHVQVAPEGVAAAAAGGVLDARGDFVRVGPVGRLGREPRVALQHQEAVVARHGGAHDVARVPRHLITIKFMRIIVGIYLNTTFIFTNIDSFHSNFMSIKVHVNNTVIKMCVLKYIYGLLITIYF